MGIHGSATRASAGVLAGEEGMFEVMELIEDVSRKKLSGFQVIFECTSDGLSANSIKELLHKW